MSRTVAVIWHASFSILAGVGYFFFVLPRLQELSGEWSPTLGLVMRIVTGAIVGLAALPVVFTLLRTRRPEYGTPELALRLRVCSIALHVAGAVLIIGTAISEIWFNVDDVGRWLFGIYGAAAAVCLLGIFAFYLAFVAELPPPPPRPLKPRPERKSRWRRTKDEEEEEAEGESVALADPKLPEARPRQIAHVLLKSAALSYLAYGEEDAVSAFGAVSAVVPVLRETESARGSSFVGRFPGVEGWFWLCFESQSGSGIAIFGMTGADEDFSVDQVGMRLRDLKEPWHWGLGTPGGSVPSAFARIVDSADVVDLRRLPGLEHMTAEDQEADEPDGTTAAAAETTEEAASTDDETPATDDEPPAAEDTLADEPARGGLQNRRPLGKFRRTRRSRKSDAGVAVEDD